MTQTFEPVAHRHNMGELDDIDYEYFEDISGDCKGCEPLYGPDLLEAYEELELKVMAQAVLLKMKPAPLDTKDLEERIKELEAENAELRKDASAKLADAASAIAEWGAYAGEYFQKKWNLAADIERFTGYAAAMTQEKTG